MEKSVEVVIMGGGISGLCAAKLLSLEHDISVIVLEARNRVGGRTNTLEDPKVKYTDLGGAYASGDRRSVLSLAKELGIETYTVHSEGKTVELLGGKRRVFSGDLSTWNPIAILDYYGMIRTLVKMGEEIPLDKPWKAPKAMELDSMSVKEFIDKACWTTYAKMLMRNAVRGFASEPHEISLLCFLWSLKAGSYVLQNPAFYEEMKCVGGAQQISNRIKDKLGDKARLSCITGWGYSCFSPKLNAPNVPMHSKKLLKILLWWNPVNTDSKGTC